MSFLDALLLEPAAFHVWIADRADRQRGSGTVSDPYNGGVDAQGISQFDTIMNLPQVAKSFAVIHLGPGTFVTNGYSDSVTGGWQVKPGMKILGSGIDVTTIKLAAVSPVAPTQYFAIGHSLPTHGSEGKDLVPSEKSAVHRPPTCREAEMVRCSNGEVLLRLGFRLRAEAA